MIEGLSLPKIQINHLEDEPEKVKFLQDMVTKTLESKFSGFEIQYKFSKNVDQFEKETSTNHKFVSNILDLYLGQRSEKSGIDAFNIWANKVNINEKNEIPIIFSAQKNKFQAELRKYPLPENIIIKPGTERDFNKICEIVSKQIEWKIKNYTNHLSDIVLIKATIGGEINFKDISTYSKQLLCNLLIHPRNLKRDYLSLDDKIIENISSVETEKITFSKRTDLTEVFYLIHSITNVVEGIILSENGGQIECFLPDLLSLTSFVNGYPQRELNKNTFREKLLRCFIVERLVAFFEIYRLDNKPIKEIVETILSLDYSDKLIFITKLWERITLKSTNSADITNRELEKIYQIGFHEFKIQNIFYGEIERELDDSFFQARLFSILKKESSFNKSFFRSVFENIGVNSEGECFKIIVYENQMNHKSYYFERITRDSFFYINS